MNKAENIVRKKFELDGYDYLDRGYTDFVFYKKIGDKIVDISFVEVKGEGDLFKPEQLLFAKLLKSLNLNYKAISVDFNDKCKEIDISRKLKKIKDLDQRRGVRINVTLPDDLHKEFRIKVFEEGKKIKDLIPELMEKYVGDGK